MIEQEKEGKREGTGKREEGRERAREKPSGVVQAPGPLASLTDDNFIISDGKCSQVSPPVDYCGKAGSPTPVDYCGKAGSPTPDHRSDRSSLSDHREATPARLLRLRLS